MTFPTSKGPLPGSIAFTTLDVTRLGQSFVWQERSKTKLHRASREGTFLGQVSVDKSGVEGGLDFSGPICPSP